MTYRHFEKLDNKMCLNLLMFKMLTAASIYSAYGQAMHFRRAMARFQLGFFQLIFIFFIFYNFIIFMCFFPTKWHWCSCGRKC